MTSINALALFLLISLAVGRVIRLFVDDEFPFGWLRNWLRQKPDLWIERLISCPWCVSGWVSLPASLVLSVEVHHRYGMVLPVSVALCWLAVWQVAVMIYFAAQGLAARQAHTELDVEFQLVEDGDA